ncbi:hypothetical protein C8R44DRAFT_819757 [Mycena epipterygia]|nr:hypothetical protein C8R44DRAFT_819757 [Mycena epipterygia]
MPTYSTELSTENIAQLQHALLTITKLEANSGVLSGEAKDELAEAVRTIEKITSIIDIVHTEHVAFSSLHWDHLEKLGISGYQKDLKVQITPEDRQKAKTLATQNHLAFHLDMIAQHVIMFNEAGSRILVDTIVIEALNQLLPEHLGFTRLEFEVDSVTELKEDVPFTTSGRTDYILALLHKKDTDGYLMLISDNSAPNPQALVNKCNRRVAITEAKSLRHKLIDQLPEGVGQAYAMCKSAKVEQMHCIMTSGEHWLFWYYHHGNDVKHRRVHIAKNCTTIVLVNQRTGWNKPQISLPMSSNGLLARVQPLGNLNPGQPTTRIRSRCRYLDYTGNHRSVPRVYVQVGITRPATPVQHWNTTADRIFRTHHTTTFKESDTSFRIFCSPCLTSYAKFTLTTHSCLRCMFAIDVSDSVMSALDCLCSPTSPT